MRLAVSLTVVLAALMSAGCARNQQEALPRADTAPIPAARATVYPAVTRPDARAAAVVPADTAAAAPADVRTTSARPSAAAPQTNSNPPDGTTRATRDRHH